MLDKLPVLACQMTIVAVFLFGALIGCTPVPEGQEQSPIDATQNDLLHVPSPEWQDQVIYFLMIDRFNDGDAGNNDQGFNEYDPTKESHYNGGDLLGITQKLDYIENLGATAVWLTPPVANQWWSSASQYSGYHGYWARDFKQVDEHYGTIADYIALSKTLHQRGMYLIQDIVVNHTGIFFGYEGDYNSEDTAENFTLFETGEQAVPDMAPFHMVDRLNPEHALADIYNWTPTANNYADLNQQFTYQLGNLSDINTKNPQVLAAFKDAYKYWMDTVGVDAFRIDTVKYVEHSFWQQFLHDEDGIYAHAKTLGKDHFLTFGEVFDASQPFSDDGEKKVISFLGSDAEPELNSVIGFPLYFELGNVLGEGKPTNQLAWRLERFMTLYPDPYVIPNFIDNHDTKRFLAGASQAALKQALATLFTIPGIPIIYQGTEQGMSETRQAMFQGGYLSHTDQFNEQAELYQFIQSLARLRTGNKLYTRGDLSILGADATGPGLLAYKRQYQEQSAIILLNTADHSILVNNMQTGLGSSIRLNKVFDNGYSNELITGAGGALSLTLPPRSILVLESSNEIIAAHQGQSDDVVIHIDGSIDGEVFEDDIMVSGGITAPGAKLKIILNGNLDAAQDVLADTRGNWKATIPVKNLGRTTYTLDVYAPDFGVVTERVQFVAEVSKPEISVVVTDPVDDAHGPDGNYQQPAQSASRQQMEILTAKAETAGANLILTLTMQEVTDDWVPANGFDNTSFSLFFNLPGVTGARNLPLIQTQMVDAQDWDLAHVAYGWGNYMYRSAHSNANEMGTKVGVSPKITVNKELGTIQFSYAGEQFGVQNWRDTKIYITTWDISGEGAYRELTSHGGEWQFAGGEPDDAKVLDSVTLRLQ